jgi:hypothetical protein
MIEIGLLLFIALCSYASYKHGFNDGVLTGVDGTIKHFARHGLFLNDEMKKALDKLEE